MNKLLLLGEAYGEVEERERTPFVGPTGYELTRLLEQAGIQRSECYLTNVFNLRPPGNKVEALCGSKAEAIKGYPAIIAGKFLHASYQPELDRLADELLETNPNLIVALGNTACWAMLGKINISKIRGTTTTSTHTADGFKCLPTYHPAAIFRQYELRPVTVLDLAKAKREAEFPEIRRPSCNIWIDPDLSDMEHFYESFIKTCPLLSVDIETAGTVVTRIGFAPSKSIAIVVPFVAAGRKGRNYWSSPAAERQALLFVRRILEDPSIPKLFQNGLYDIAFIWRAWGIKVMGAEEDTMLCHHAMQPESLKGLGFLGSVYTDHGSWKDMRKVETIKKDD